MSIILMGIHEGKGFAWLIKIPEGLKGILIIFTNKGQHFFFFFMVFETLCGILTSKIRNPYNYGECRYQN